MEHCSTSKRNFQQISSSLIKGTKERRGDGSGWRGGPFTSVCFNPGEHIKINIEDICPRRPAEIHWLSRAISLAVRPPVIIYKFNLLRAKIMLMAKRYWSTLSRSRFYSGQSPSLRGRNGAPVKGPLRLKCRLDRRKVRWLGPRA